MGRVPSSSDASSQKVASLWIRLLPNGLTVARIVLAFAFPFLDKSLWLAVVVVATLTEFFDGYLARKLNVESAIGRQMDPVADKLFVIGVVYTFYAHELLTLPQILLVGARDLMVVVGGVLAWAFGLGRDFLDVSPKYSGKVATTFQFAFLIGVSAFQSVNDLFLYTTIAVSIIAAADYFVLGVLRLKDKYTK